MKKFFAVFMSIILVFTMIPMMAFAEEEQLWDDAYDRVVGDVVFAGNTICDVYLMSDDAESVTVNMEISNVTDEDAGWVSVDYPEEWDYELETSTLKRSNVVDMDKSAYINAPLNVIVDEIIYEGDSITYKLHKVQNIGGWYTEVGSNCAEGDYVYNFYPMGEDQTLTVETYYYDDKEHTAPLLINGEACDTVEVLTESGMESTMGFAPTGVRVDGFAYDESTNTVTMTAYKQLWNRDDYNKETEDCNLDLRKGDSPWHSIVNLQSKDLTFEYIIFEDDTCQNPIYKEGYYHSEIIVTNESCEYDAFSAPEDINFAQIIDNTSAEEPKLTFCYYLRSSLAKDEHRNAFEQLKDESNKAIDSLEVEKIHLKVADPDKLNIPGYDKEALERYLDGVSVVIKETDLQGMYSMENISGSGAMALLRCDLYADKDLTQNIAYYDMGLEPNKTYYLDVYYDVSVTYLGNEEIHVGNPIEFSYEYVDVDSNSDEVAQIIANSEKNLECGVEDLSWINTLVVNGFNAYVPSVKNQKAFFSGQYPELYESMVGDTDLEIFLEYGRSGDGGLLAPRTSAVPHYYVDDVYYGNTGYSGDGYLNSLFLTSVMYVPEGTEDRAKTAEERINNFLGDGNIKASITKAGVKEISEYLNSRYYDSDFEENIDDIKAVYMTDQGLALYSHETLTDKEHFLGSTLNGFANEYLTDLFKNSQLEEVGVLEYVKIHNMEFNDAKAYIPYKLTLEDTENGVSKDYICIIGIGTEKQLEEPYAEWKDEATGIVTKGENGYVPFDAYTKIRVIEGGNEIKFIQNKVGGDKVVNAYDINAYTNFKGGKLEDLGNGLMKVMIPLGTLSEDGLNAHYVDNEGNVYNLEYTIEEYEGQEYVCFITNHFSTYAISGVEVAEDMGDGVLGENEGTGEDDKLPESTTPDAETDAPEKAEPDVDTPNTGDNSGIVGWIMLAFVSLVGAFAFGRKEITR